MSKKCIGIRREDKNIWERRVPLSSEHVKKLKEKHGIQTVLQPFEKRAFSDQTYLKVGAIINEDLSNCPVILAVKEIPLKYLFPDKTYIFFSHVIKGQKYNMPLLKKIMELKCTLIDYECIKDEKGRRLVFFGRYAGLAGMIEALHGIGIKYHLLGYDTPFIHVKSPHEYRDIDHAKTEIKKVGKEIKKFGLPNELMPFVVGFTGYGHVSEGAQEIFDLLPFEEILPGELETLSCKRNDILYKVIFKEEHMVEPVDKNARFVLQEYYDHPEKYKGVFDKYINHLNVIANCIYWDKRYPRVVTKKFLNENPNSKMKLVADISCDVNGSIEFVEKVTTPDKPALTYNPETGKVSEGYGEEGVSVIAIDNLPCEVPVDSSSAFSKALYPLIPGIVNADFSLSFTDVNLPSEIKRAVIVYKGELTKDFEYLKQYLNE